MQVDEVIGVARRQFPNFRCQTCGGADCGHVTWACEDCGRVFPDGNLDRVFAAGKLDDPTNAKHSACALDRVVRRARAKAGRCPDCDGLLVATGAR